MDPSNSSYLSNIAIFHFHIYCIRYTLQPRTTDIVSLGDHHLGQKIPNNFKDFLGAKELPLRGLPIRPTSQKINGWNLKLSHLQRTNSLLNLHVIVFQPFIFKEVSPSQVPTHQLLSVGFPPAHYVQVQIPRLKQVEHAIHIGKSYRKTYFKQNETSNSILGMVMGSSAHTFWGHMYTPALFLALGII